jgi:hypothetical protein
MTAVADEFPRSEGSSISVSRGSPGIIRLVIKYSQARIYWRFGSYGPVPISTRRPRDVIDFNRVRVARWESATCFATAAVDRATPSLDKARMRRSVSSVMGLAHPCAGNGHTKMHPDFFQSGSRKARLLASMRSCAESHCPSVQSGVVRGRPARSRDSATWRHLA